MYGVVERKFVCCREKACVSFSQSAFKAGFVEEGVCVCVVESVCVFFSQSAFKAGFVEEVCVHML